MKATVGILLGTSALLLMGCMSGADTSEVPVEVIYASPKCGVGTEKVRLTSLTSMDEVSVFWLRANSAPMKPPLPKNIDIPEKYLVLVELGRQNTGGHELVVTGTMGQLTAGMLSLPLVESHPSDGALTTQVVTSPCVLFQIPRKHVRSVSALGRSVDIRGGE